MRYVIPQLLPVLATTHPQSADSVPRFCLIYIAVRLLITSARISSSSVLWFSLANTTTGMVVQIPWFPLPLLLITGTMAPAIRASQAQLVADSILEKMLSPMIP